MPSQTPTSTIAAYAAGASLAAVTLVYVFSPSLFLDDSGNTGSSSSSRRRSGVVGLSNPANDCFINSVLQALAGLGELRVYLIRELHRRQLLLHEDAAAFDIIEVDPGRDGMRPDDRRRGRQRVLQASIVTAALKGVLDALNERPLYQKTVTNGDFVKELEKAFGTRISRQQQDAQEFLQLVAERVEEEWVALGKVRKQIFRRRLSRRESPSQLVNGNDDTSAAELVNGANDSTTEATNGTRESKNQPLEEELKIEEDDSEPTTPNPFPFSGMLESYVECQTCHFIPKPSKTPFVTLTLNVPQSSSQTTLDACIDGLLKREHIDDYKCDRCRLEHAISRLQTSMDSATSDERKLALNSDIVKLQAGLSSDPSSPPEDVTLPPMDQAPKRRIFKHLEITSYPRILAIHLSRSIFSGTSSKNTSKVTFPEILSLGGLKDRRQYRLLALITHQGAHNSGHYETFRRQIVLPSYSTRSNGHLDKTQSNDHDKDNALHRGSSGSVDPPPPLDPSLSVEATATATTTLSPRSSLASTTTATSSTATTTSTSTSTATTTATPPPPAPPPLQKATSSSSSTSLSRRISPSSLYTSSIPSLRRKRAKNTDRWWRISDEKVRECDTTDVLGMRGEVYMLFYEMVG